MAWGVRYVNLYPDREAFSYPSAELAQANAQIHALAVAVPVRFEEPAERWVRPAPVRRAPSIIERPF